MNRIFGDDLPSPAADRLVFYLLGPGVGESQVLVFPDGGTLVVDSCRSGSVNLTRALLDHLGISTIDLLVLTHPDLDHVRGFGELVRECGPKQIWRYPCAGVMRDFAAGLLRITPGDDRFADVHDALVAIDEHLEVFGEPTDAYFDRTWKTTGYEIRCIAPTPYDVYRANRFVKECVSFLASGRPRFSPRFGRFLHGQTSLGDAPNVLSVALAVRWGDVRLLLGGDLMNGCAKAFSGWKGVVRLLNKQGRACGDLVESVAAVKVPHHGSRGAFSPGTWDCHAKGDSATVAMLTPFKTVLPAADVLNHLRKYCSRLCVSRLTAGAEPYVKTGWVPTTSGTMAGTEAPCVVASFLRDGAVTLHSGLEASVLNRIS